MRGSGLLSTLTLMIGVLSPTPLATADAVTDDGAVIAREVIGYSVEGRQIVAFHLGRPGKPKAVVIAAMHGNESAPRQILYALKNGAKIHELDLWVIPTYNPDGFAAGTRQNAHGVDLNRNFPYHWIEQHGATESGPEPASEPETQAVMAFLDRERPRWIVSFHQPLNGVDRDTKWPNFSRKLGRYLNLPLKDFVCGGVCHGTMTGWFNHNYGGAADTVEYSAHPGHYRMTVTAPRQLVRALGGWRG